DPRRRRSRRRASGRQPRSGEAREQRRAAGAVARRRVHFSALREVGRRRKPLRDGLGVVRPRLEAATRAMNLAPGARLGPYEIVASIGAGGMGAVFRARDTRLERTVAIKVL